MRGGGGGGGEMWRLGGRVAMARYSSNCKVRWTVYLMGTKQKHKGVDSKAC